MRGLRLAASRFDWFAACFRAPSHCLALGSGHGIVSAQTGALEGARTGFVQLLGKAGSMSVMGQKQTFRIVRAMSALPPKADIGTQSRDVRFVPKADIRELFDHPVGAGEDC